MPIAKTQILAIRNDTNPEIEMILNIARGTTDPEYWVISTAWNNLAPDMEQAKNPECQAGRVDIAAVSILNNILQAERRDRIYNRVYRENKFFKKKNKRNPQRISLRVS